MKLSWQDPNIIKNITELLQKNNILVTTTDTIPGFLSNLTQQSVDQLNKIKGSRSEKPYIILISDFTKLQKFVDLPALSTEIHNMISQLWPGPLTAIFKAKSDLPDFLKSKTGTVALRCPKHAGLLAVLENFDGLFSTSANKSGQPTPQSINDIEADVLAQVDCIVNSSDSEFNQASTILDFSRYDANKKIYLVRQGAYSIADIKKYINISNFNE